ncbi:hypothetical protein CFE70_003746 [Pyrenophora teres f. teres 0-1]
MSSESPLEVYESAITTGKRLCKELASFKAQPPLPASLASCGYEVESGKLRSNTETSLRPMLQSCGILISNSIYVEVSSAGTAEHHDVAYNNWFDPHHGLIVCNENYKSRDVHSGDKKIWPSEVLWQSWKGTALGAGKPASDLCAIHSSSSRIEENNQVEYTCLDNGFYAILGTPNGASTMRMLRDHRTELGYRIVEKIVVFGNKDLTMQMPEARTMAILLSDRRTPPSRIPIPISSSRHTS